MRLQAAVILALLTFPGQQAPAPPRPAPPPRDVVAQRPEPVGTAVIRGRVVAADTGNPIRRANVSLLPAAPQLTLGSTAPPAAGPSISIVQPSRSATAPPSMIRSRTATTDSQGAFEFTGLPAGSYRVLVSPGQYSAQYVAMTYGAKAASGPFMPDSGTPIQLTDGQTFGKAVIVLPRGAVITGRVTDDTGEPMARVQVYTLFFPAGATRGQRNGAGAQTDDLGQFRLFGLNAGQYVVAAEARGNTFVPPNAPPETEESKIGFITTYYPGATDEAGGQRVRARTGAETGGIEIRMVQGRLFHIAGSVVDSQGRPAARTNVQLSARQGNGGVGFGASTDEQGQFQMRNIPPGNYRVIARSDLGPRGPQPPPNPGEMASVPVTLSGDVDNLLIAMGPGTTIVGHIVFEQGPPSPLPNQMRVMATTGPSDDYTGLPSPPPATVTPDLGFTMKGLMGELLLRASAPNQYLKSVMVNGDDITDAAHEFKTSDRVVVTLTSRVSTIEGTVTDLRGAPSTDAGIIVFSEDKALWQMNATRTRRGGADASGQFRVTGLMPGRYFIAAAPRARLNIPSPGAGAEFFEQLSKEATSVVLGEDEQRRIDLKVLEPGGQ